MGIRWHDGYSSEVAIWLLVDGVRYPVAQVGPDSIVLRSVEHVRNGHAKLIVSIDGNEEVSDVILSASGGCASELAYA